MHTHTDTHYSQANPTAARSELNASPRLQVDSSCYLKSEVGNLVNFNTSVFQQAQVQRKATQTVGGMERLLCRVSAIGTCCIGPSHSSLNRVFEKGWVPPSPQRLCVQLNNFDSFPLPCHANGIYRNVTRGGMDLQQEVGPSTLTLTLWTLNLEQETLLHLVRSSLFVPSSAQAEQLAGYVKSIRFGQIAEDLSFKSERTSRHLSQPPSYPWPCIKACCWALVMKTDPQDG